MIGKMLAHYGFEELLGEGGSGVVYRGRDLRLDRPVAIKVLADALREDEFAWARLLREARLASQLNHPHIAAIYDLGEDNGRAYIVMEYVEGLPLAEVIPDGGMPLEQVERYAEQIADALAFAHEHGTLHGDLKGLNIMVTPEGNIKLLDFGLGRRIPRSGTAEVTSPSLPLAEVGATSGTLPYLAPEVLRGNPTSVQSDIWALGVLLYQMSTGELPFSGVTPFDLSVEIMVGKPSKLEQLPEPLQSALRGALEKDPTARTAQVRDFLRALDRNSRPDQPAATPLPEAAAEAAPTVPAAAPAPPNRRKWWAAAAALTLGLVLLAGIYTRNAWVAGHTVHPVVASPVVASQVSGSPLPKPAATENPDAKVWVNTDSGTYHCPGTRWYGKTQQGKYMAQKQAEAQGYRPAAKHACM